MGWGEIKKNDKGQKSVFKMEFKIFIFLVP